MIQKILTTLGKKFGINPYFLGPKPENKTQLMQAVSHVLKNHLMDANALSMIKGVIEVSEMQAKDVMVPKSQMVVIHHHQPLSVFLPAMVASAHSRFPVVGEDNESIMGILLAKTLLHHIRFHGMDQPVHLPDLLHPAVFIPESKRLDQLLKEFRDTHRHMAIVVDEYDNTAGLITIEDVLEQIVGDIEDENYTGEKHQFIQKKEPHLYLVHGLTPIDDFNDYFHAQLDDTEFDTLGGLVAQQFGRLPKRGETLEIQGFSFTVVRADNRRIRQLQVHLPTHSLVTKA